MIECRYPITRKKTKKAISIKISMNREKEQKIKIRNILGRSEES